MSENAVFGNESRDYIFLASFQTISGPPTCPKLACLPSWCADYLHLDPPPLGEYVVKYVDNKHERYRLNVKGKGCFATGGSVATR